MHRTQDRRAPQGATPPDPRARGCVVVVAVALTLAAGGMAWAGFKASWPTRRAPSQPAPCCSRVRRRGTSRARSSSTVDADQLQQRQRARETRYRRDVGHHAGGGRLERGRPGHRRPDRGDTGCARRAAWTSCSTPTSIDTGPGHGRRHLRRRAGRSAVSGIAFDGSDGWFESTASYSTPAAFTLLAWFKAGTGRRRHDLQPVEFRVRPGRHGQRPQPLDRLVGTAGLGHRHARRPGCRRRPKWSRAPTR